MNIRATIIKLLLHYTPSELLGHLANELDQQAAHFLTVGAPLRADYLRRQAESLRATKKELADLPYVVVPEGITS